MIQPSSSTRWVHRALPATAFRDFNFLWLAATSSAIALWTNLLGNAWVVFKLSDSSGWVAVAVFASMVPFLLAPIGGVIADRFERRGLLSSTRGIAFLGSVALFVFALTGLISVWLVVLVAFLLGVVRSVETPSEQALAANTVSHDALASAITLTTTTRLGSRAVGPILAGPLLATVGVEGAYGVAAVFALFGFLFTLPVKTRSFGGVTAGTSVVEGFVQGVTYVRNSRPVFAIMLLTMLHCALTMSFDSMLPGYAEHHLHDPDLGFTMLSLGVGIGAFTGSLALSFSGKKGRGTIYLATAIISGLSPSLLFFFSTTPSAATAAAVMGASQAVTMALSGVLLQEIVDDKVRGRVMSLYLMSAGGIMAFGNLGLGALADFTGAPILFLIPGLAFSAIVLASIPVSSNLRRVYGTGSALQRPVSIAASPAGGGGQ